MSKNKSNRKLQPAPTRFSLRIRKAEEKAGKSSSLPVRQVSDSNSSRKGHSLYLFNSTDPSSQDKHSSSFPDDAQTANSSTLKLRGPLQLSNETDSDADEETSVLQPPSPERHIKVEVHDISSDEEMETDAASPRDTGNLPPLVLEDTPLETQSSMDTSSSNSSAAHPTVIRPNGAPTSRSSSSLREIVDELTPSFPDSANPDKKRKKPDSADLSPTHPILSSSPQKKGKEKEKATNCPIPVPLPQSDGSILMNALLSAPVLETFESENGINEICNLSPPTLESIATMKPTDMKADIEQFFMAYKPTVSINPPSHDVIRNLFLIKYQITPHKFALVAKQGCREAVASYDTIRKMKILPESTREHYGDSYLVHDLLGLTGKFHFLDMVQLLYSKASRNLDSTFSCLIEDIFWNDKGLPDCSFRLIFADKTQIGKFFNPIFHTQSAEYLEFSPTRDGNLKSSVIRFPRNLHLSPHILIHSNRAKFFVPFDVARRNLSTNRGPSTVMDFEVPDESISLSGIDSIIKFFQFMINNKGICLTLYNEDDLDAYGLYFMALLEDYNNAFELFSRTPSEEHYCKLERSFIFLNTIPTYLLLFPENRWSKVRLRLKPLMSNRWTFFQSIKDKDFPVIPFRKEDFFNRPRTFTYSRSSPIKAALKDVAECQLSRGYGRVHRTYNVPTPIDPDPDVKYEELVKLHPIDPNPIRVDAPVLLTEAEEDHIKIHRDEVIAYFSKAKQKGTSSGPDGLSACIIHMLLIHKESSSRSFANIISTYLTNLIHPKTPVSFWKVLTTAKLFGFTKSDNISQRPLANGLLLRKAIGSILLNKFRGDISTALGPHQLGIAVTMGTEKIGHLFNHLFENRDSFFLKTDLRNAFNSFSRPNALKTLIEHIPKLGNIVRMIYGISNTLLYENYPQLDANMGSQQGCPLGPLLFSFAFKPILDELQTEYPNAIMKAYVDDLTIAYPNNFVDIQSLLKKFNQLTANANLSLNMGKCQIVVPDQCNSPLRDIAERCRQDIETGSMSNRNASIDKMLMDMGFQEENIIHNNPRENPDKIGIEILGFPVGTTEYQAAFFNDKVDKYIKESACIKNLPHYQSQWVLFLYNLQAKLSHLMRVIHPDITIPLLHKVINADTRLLFSIFDFHGLSNELKTRISNQFYFKISEGGFNKKNYNHVAISAYLGSSLTVYSYVMQETDRHHPLSNSSLWIQNLARLLSHTRSVIEGDQHRFDTTTNDTMSYIKLYLTSLISANHEGSYLNFPYKKLQKRISEALYERVTKSLERLPDDDRLSATSKTNQYYSGKWLFLPPTPNSFFDNAVFRMAIAIKLNLDLIKPGHKCPHCNQVLDPKGHHFLSCASASLKRCHNMVRDIMAEYLESIGYCVETGEIPIHAYSGITPLSLEDQQEAQLLPFRSDQLEVTLENPNNNNKSTKGTRVDGLATKPGTGEQPIMFDMQVLNSVAPTFTSMEARETQKENLHTLLVEEQYCRYWAPTFDCFGNPSKKTESFMKALYENYLASLPTSSKNLMLVSGRPLNFWFSKISYAINQLKAWKTLLLLNDLKGNLFKKPAPGKISEHRRAQALMRYGR